MANYEVSQDEIGNQHSATGGQDRFSVLWSPGTAPDTISGFQTGASGDILDIASLIQVLNLAPWENPFTSDLMRLVANGANTVLQVFWNGNWVPAVTILGSAPASFGHQNFDPQWSQDNTETFNGLKPGGEIIDGTLNDDTITGLAGDDTIRGYAGADVVDGSGGSDWIDYSLDAAFGGTSSISIYLGGTSGSFAYDGFGNSDTLTSIENVRATAYDDYVLGDEGTNVLHGLGANDYLDGRGGDDTILGGAGVDEIEGADGADDVNGGAGDDLILGGTGDDAFDGGAGFDTLDYQAEGGPDGVRVNLAGTAWDYDGEISFSLAAETASDTFEDLDEVRNLERVIGTDLDDYFRGSDADEVFLVTVGDLVYAGGGTDGVSHELGGGGSGVVVDLNSNFDQLENVENVIGTEFADELRGTVTANVLAGLQGADQLDGRGGTDTADYSQGQRIEFSPVDGIIVNLSGTEEDGVVAGTALDEYGDTDTLTSIENAIGTNQDDRFFSGSVGNRFEGGAGDDSLFGGGGADVLLGGEDDDTFVGGDGADSFAGGEGSGDRITYRGEGGSLGVTVDLAAGTATDSFGKADTFSGIEEVVGTDKVDTIRGDGASNFFRGFNGADSYFGRGGSDQVAYDGETGTQRVVVNLLTGAGTDTYGKAESYNSIEAVTGSMNDDVIIGNDDDNRFRGMEGDDTISGGLGRDRVRYDRDAERGGTLGAVVDLAAGTAIDGFGDADDLTGIEDVEGTQFDDTIRGSATANFLVGHAGDDILLGLAGDDHLVGGAGNDDLRGGETADDYDVADFSGEDRFTDHDDFSVMYHDTGLRVNLSDSVKTVPDTEGEEIEARSAHGLGEVDDLYGIEFLIGWSAVEKIDVIFGRNDEGEAFAGLAGADYFDGGGGLDEVRYDRDDSHGGLRGVVVNLAARFAIDGFGTRDTLVDIESIQATRFTDRLTGDNAANRFRGLGGDDTFGGGAGLDMVDYIVDVFDGGNAGVSVNLSNATFEHADFGSIAGRTANDGFGDIDRFTSIEQAAGTDKRDLLVGRNQAGSGDYLRGEGGNDVVYAQRGDDRVEGDAGDDELDGGQGTDDVHGGSGADRFRNTASDGDTDTLTGGAGRDSYEVVWVASNEADVITDFAPGAFGDVISIAPLLQLAGRNGYKAADNPFETGYLRLRQAGEDTLLEINPDGFDGPLGWSSVLVLRDTEASALRKQNFAPQWDPNPSFPIARNDAAEVLEDGSRLIDVLANDLDRVGDELSLLSATQGEHGTVAIIGGKIRYTPDASYHGSDTFTYRIADGLGGTDTGTVSVTVAAVNDGPHSLTLAGAKLEAAEFSAIGTSVGRVVGNDVDDRVLTYSLMDDAGGRFAITKEGLLVVRNGLLFDFEQEQNHTVRIRVSDGDGAFLERSFTVTVGNVDPERVTGSEAADRLVGGSSRDVVFGEGGADALSGGAGGDYLQGSGGQDQLRGGLGRDALLGGDARDILFGETGDDRTLERSGTGNLSGGLWGQAGNDDLYGGAGADLLAGGDGADRLFGGSGDDSTAGPAGGRSLGGLWGEAGDDEIWGGTGADQLSGGGGDDVLHLDGGNDRAWGNAGADRFVFTEGFGVDRVNDFRADDVLVFDGVFSSRSQLLASLEQTGNVVVIDAPGGGGNAVTIILIGIETLTGSHFELL